VLTKQIKPESMKHKHTAKHITEEWHNNR